MSDWKEAQDLQTAFMLHRSERFDEAAKLYRKIIKRNPRNVHALHSLGLIEAATYGNLPEATRLMARSLAIEPNNLEFLGNYATILYQQGNYEAALQAAQKGAASNGASLQFVLLSASSLQKLGRFTEALAQFDAILAQAPNELNAINQRNIVLLEMKDYDAALAGVEKALSLYPRLADAYLTRGIACAHLERPDEALAAFQQALALEPQLGNAWLGYGNTLYSLCRYDEARAAYDKARMFNADMDSVWLGIGNVAYNSGRIAEASEAYDKSLAINPRSAETWLGIGHLSRLSRDYEKAVSAYDKALATDPGLLSAKSGRFSSRMHLCDWAHASSDFADLTRQIKVSKDAIEPFLMIATDYSAEDHLALARRWIEKRHRASDRPLWTGDVYRHDRIRVGYVSADLHEHATAYLIAGVFENHDRSKFDVTAISIGPNDNSPMRRRLENSFETFVDASALGDAEVAAKIRDAEIDILIDLKGFTRNARTDIFARRPAPVQVSYLGYPGTMGADYIDYMIADPTVIPSSQQSSYAEKIVRLPHSYQANDTTRTISDRVFSREEFGLPADEFVFCSFNSSFKITADVFGSWMRVLAEVPGSVLWLFESNAAASANLIREAKLRGIAAERIIFAKAMPHADHLARHRLADLFIDNVPCNAHTTASDALWAGLPVLTQIGNTFAGRVAASLLNAIDLPELIAETPEDYELKAIDLALHPEKLDALKQKLADNRLTTPLFDTALFTRHLEAAYAAMYERFQQGLPPDHIRIAG